MIGSGGKEHVGELTMVGSCLHSGDDAALSTF
jgi:hypothetical protein